MTDVKELDFYSISKCIASAMKDTEFDVCYKFKLNIVKREINKLIHKYGSINKVAELLLEYHNNETYEILNEETADDVEKLLEFKYLLTNLALAKRFYSLCENDENRPIYSRLIEDCYYDDVAYHMLLIESGNVDRAEDLSDTEAYETLTKVLDNLINSDIKDELSEKYKNAELRVDNKYAYLVNKENNKNITFASEVDLLEALRLQGDLVKNFEQGVKESIHLINELEKTFGTIKDNPQYLDIMRCTKDEEKILDLFEDAFVDLATEFRYWCVLSGHSKTIFIDYLSDTVDMFMNELVNDKLTLDDISKSNINLYKYFDVSSKARGIDLEREWISGLNPYNLEETIPFDIQHERTVKMLEYIKELFK